MNEIVLITRIRTLNKGNQALSAAWLSMIEQAFPDASVRLIERRPRHLLQYTLKQLARSRDPIAALDALATKLAGLAPGERLAGNNVARPEILLDETIPPPPRFAALRQRLNLRGRMAAAGVYAKDYRRRLSAMQRARLVVVNPAGEFFPREPLAAFYHVLDAYVAHLLGRPTAIVNHTMDIDDPTLHKIIPHVYRQLDLVGFRDEKSVPAFRAMGGDLKNVLVTPDLALITRLHTQTVPRASTVAIAINVPEAAAHGYLSGWSEVIANLRSYQLAVELVSNELPADVAFYEQIQRRFPDVKISGAGLDHDRYTELLGTYQLVVTSRMHTGILAMVAGTPVVPVEGASFKITGLFQELGVTTPVIRPATSGWASLVVEQAMEMTKHRTEAASDFTAKLASARERIVRLLVPRLQSAARATGN